MNKFRFSAVLPCLLLLSAPLAAQWDRPSYLVTPKLDTIYGSLESRTFGKDRLMTPTDKIVCDPAQYIALYDSSKRAIYRSVTIPNALTADWLQLLEPGPIQLYHQRIERPKGTSVYWYAGKNNGPLQQVKTVEVWGSRKAQKGALHEFMQDDTVMLQQLATLESFKFEDIRYLIRKYNKRAQSGHAVAAAPPYDTTAGPRDFVIALNGQRQEIPVNNNELGQYPKAEYDGKTTLLKPAHFLAYYSEAEKSLYVSLTPLSEAGYQWYRALERGAITLYQLRKGEPGDCLVIKAGDGLLTEMNTSVNWAKKSRKARLRALISDDAELTQSFDQAGELTTELVREVIKKYNQRRAAGK